MRSIDPDIVAQLQGRQLRPFILVDITIGATTYRYTDCDIDLAYDGNLYLSYAIAFGNISYGMGAQIVDKVDLNISNINSVFTGMLIGNDVRGEEVIIRLVVLDDDYKNIPDAVTAVVLFQGTIDAWRLSETEVSITVASLMTKWSQNSLAKYSPSCRWRLFGGTECQYATASGTWCDRTYTRCVALGGTQYKNFGGFRYIPSVTGKEVWWGISKK